MADPAAGILDRTLARLRRGWHDVAGRGRASLADTLGPGLDDAGVDRLRQAIEECLAARGGAVSGLARAADLGETYLKLDADGRRRFMALLFEEFGSDDAAVDVAARLTITSPDREARNAAQARLAKALVPRRIALFRQLGALPDGVKFLVDLRAELRLLGIDRAVRKAIDEDLRGLLASWFDVGFLDLRRIGWDASAELLERLIAYEAVHEIRSWTDLKNRLDSDRRCFAFFHPRMPAEPLIFVEVALVSGMADNIQHLLDEDAPAADPTSADTAIFYSISNAQSGLAGISFGNFLIKRVVDLLRQEFPNLKAFATLSPVPGFRTWLDRALKTGEGVPDDEVAEFIGDLDQDWPNDAERREAMREPLTRLAAHYLLTVKRGDRVADPVGNFHLTNGARLERINFLADTSEKGLRESAGVMVNYLYKLSEIEKNHEVYSEDGTVRRSNQVRSLLKT
jgi:malonyl-CoA decarboxylase